MLRGNKKIMMIIALCLTLLFIGVGYAILTAELNITGKASMTGVFDIEIVDMKVLSTTGMAKEGEYSFDELTATFSHNLYAPGDSIEYEITIENKGNVKASLKQITTSLTPEYDDLILTNSLSQGQVMEPGTYSTSTATIEGGTKITFTVKSEFDIQATKLPDTAINPKYTLEMIFHQYQGNNIVTPPDYSTDNVCFTIASDGTLKDYDYNCGLDVVVPMSVDGINVTKLDSTSFTTDDASFFKQLGFGSYSQYSVYNMYNSQYEYYFMAEDQNTLDLVKEYYGYTGKSNFDFQNYRYFLTGSLENNYIYTGYWATPLDGEGNENYDDSLYMLQWYYDPYEFYVVDSQEGYNAAKTYMDNSGLDSSLLYVSGDPAIADTNYKIDLKTYFEENAAEFIPLYTDGKVDVMKASNMITSLDLSSAIYLETIDTKNKFDSLNSLVFPEGNLKTIKSSAFSGNYLGNITKIIIPSTVEEIGLSAFSSMKKGSVINVNRPQEGMTLGNSWSGQATVNFLE